MKLYHWTTLLRAAHIGRDGLRANAAPVGDFEKAFLTNGIPCVWFYDVPERPTLSREFALAYGGHRVNLSGCFARLEVTISKNDGRLHHWPTWASEQGFDATLLPAEFTEQMNSTWIFFGDVKRKKINGLTIVRPHEEDVELRKRFDEEMAALEAAA